MFNPETNQKGFFVYSKPYKTPRLKAITNGFGIQTTLNYKPLTDSSVYTFFGCSDMSSIGISLTIFSAGKFIRLKVFFLNPTKT
jgi:hypothetical protein